MTFPRTRVQNNKEQIYCDWRHRFVRLTPEEWVRQQFLHRLTERYGYPAGLIGVEISLGVRRADAVVYNRDMQPRILLEFKADMVPLTQQVLDQAAGYNRRLHVPWLILHNGPHTLIARVEDQTITFKDSIPAWSEL
ncbi:MAG: type I restriction enzyme HsdR N-terminal domain-containing protein [Paludibacteraceae bacterium]|nr:type I restriction enzyme HsdR N-terminal domain-containing protein [Paludibacteraceae bacterium]